MKIGSIVNIKMHENGKCWKGKVIKIVEVYKPIVVIKGIDSQDSAVMFEHELYLKNDEYWEKE